MYTHILTSLLSYSAYRISSKRLLTLANEIAYIFHGENKNTYSIPSAQVDKQIVPPSGKLVDHYNYSKWRLREDGHLKPKVTKSTDAILNISETGILIA